MCANRSRCVATVWLGLVALGACAPARTADTAGAVDVDAAAPPPEAAPRTTPAEAPPRATPAATADAAPDAPAVVPAAADAAPPPAGFAVTTLRYGNDRLGWDRAETRLTPATIDAQRFGKLFARKVDGQVTGQALYLSGVAVPGAGARNLFFVATANNAVYAFDADDPPRDAPIWRVDLGAVVPWKMLCDYCDDLRPGVGIVGTPAIDPATRTLYVVAKTLEDGRVVQRLAALDVATGAHRKGSPVVITAALPGTGEDGQNGMVPFNPLRNLNRAGLVVHGGRVFVAFGSHGDARPYHGWVLAYDAATLQQTGAFTTTPDGAQGSIWGAGGGLVADAAGNLLFPTGNGTTRVDGARPQLSEAVVKLSTTNGELKLADWFVASDYDDLNKADHDLGTSPGMLLPGNRFLTGSKTGFGYLLDAANLGKLVPGDTQIQKFDAVPTNPYVQHFGGFVYWESAGGALIYSWPMNSKLLGWRVAGGKVQTPPALTAAGSTPFPSGMLTVSSNGGADGVLWASHPLVPGTNANPPPGELRAFDALTLKELWNSRMNVARDDPGPFAKFVPPTVANGRVYLPTWGGTVVVYGPL